jgi:hypothetical protein
VLNMQNRLIVRWLIFYHFCSQQYFGRVRRHRVVPTVASILFGGALFCGAFIDRLRPYMWMSWLIERETVLLKVQLRNTGCWKYIIIILIIMIIIVIIRIIIMRVELLLL